MSEVSGKPVYGICGCKEKVQVLSVDQVADLIQQMASNNWQVPADYIPKTSVNGIIDQNTKKEVKLWIGTQAQYDELADTSNLFAIISDDPTLANLEEILKQHGQSIENINARIDKIVDGTTRIGDTTKVQGVDLSDDTSANFGDYIVSKKKVLYSNANGFTVSTVNKGTITLSEKIKVGDILEIKCSPTYPFNTGIHIIRFIVDGLAQDLGRIIGILPFSASGDMVFEFGNCNFKITSETTIEISTDRFASFLIPSTGGQTVKSYTTGAASNENSSTVYEISKIIE